MLVPRSRRNGPRSATGRKTTTTICSTCSISRDTRAKALYREGYTPIGGGDLVNSHGDGEFNLRDLHLNSTLTFTMSRRGPLASSLPLVSIARTTFRPRASSSQTTHSSK